MTRHVINLLVHDRFALCGITNAYTRYPAKGVSSLVLARFCLSKSRINPPHHLPAHHTNFVQDKETHLAEVFLQTVKLVM